MPFASSIPRYSSTLTSRFGPEWRSGASGKSRRITCAWQSTAASGSNDNRFSRLAVLRLALRRGQEFLLERLHLVDRHDLVQLLERNQRVGTIDDLAGVERFAQEREPALHAAKRARGEEPRIDHDGDAEVLQLLRRKQRRRRALPNAESHVHAERL